MPQPPKPGKKPVLSDFTNPLGPEALSAYQTYHQQASNYTTWLREEAKKDGVTMDQRQEFQKQCAQYDDGMRMVQLQIKNIQKYMEVVEQEQE